MSPETMTVIKNVILTCLYLGCGIVCIFVGIKTLVDKTHKNKIPTAIFYIGLGTALGFGEWIQKFITTAVPSETYKFGNVIVGLIVVIMTIPAILGKVTAGKNDVVSKEYSSKQSDKIGNKIFIPALSIGATALLFAFFLPKIGAIPGLAVGVVIASIIILYFSKDKPRELLTGGKRLIENIGPLVILPMLLASLGAVFTAAKVGDIISKGVSFIIPQGNITVGIIVYALGMALFTMIMGNAFAAFSVMTVGIGVPFVLQYGLNPNLIGMLALTCGFCGTLMTPMAANFNIVPVAVLEMKDKYGVIKNQIFIAICMLVVQILMMILLG